MPSKLYLFPHAALVSFGYLIVLVDGSLWSTLSTSGTLLSPQLFTGARSNFKAKCHKRDCFLGTRDPYLYHLKKLLPLSGHLTVGIETFPGMNINGNVFKFSNYCQLLCSPFHCGSSLGDKSCDHPLTGFLGGSKSPSPLCHVLQCAHLGEWRPHCTLATSRRPPTSGGLPPCARTVLGTSAVASSVEGTLWGSSVNVTKCINETKGCLLSPGV